MSELVLGGRPYPDALDQIRRYCGLEWSGGEREVFAFSYFDALAERREDDEVRPVDVLAAGTLHSAPRKRDLAYFVEHAEELHDELALLPSGADLADATEPILDRLATVGARLRPACGLSLLTKVLHAKRPRLVPMLDRAITDCYRQQTNRRGEEAWPACVRLLASDLAEARNREVLAGFRAALQPELGSVVPSVLRLADIVIWMGAAER